MLQNFVLSAKSMKNTKLDHVRKFLQLQYANMADKIEVFRFKTMQVLTFCAVSHICSDAGRGTLKIVVDGVTIVSPKNMAARQWTEAIL